MLPIKVGLVDTTGRIDKNQIISVAAALNTQVTRDLPQFWVITATVDYLPNPKSIPQGYWPVLLVEQLPPGEGGFHLTKHNQPYAKVIATPGNADWSIDAAHEIIEMLIDPSGNRLQASTAIKIASDGSGVVDGVGQFEYLVEACDPCEANGFAYQIDGVTVSDFLTPHYYDLAAAPGARYSFTGAIERPRQLLRGGYISYVDPQSNEIQQILWVNPGRPQLKSLGSAQGASLRVFVENKTLQAVHKVRVAAPRKVVAMRERHRKVFEAAALYRAKHYK